MSQTPNASGLGGKGKAIILVVDRDPHIRELEAHFLQRAGYSVGFEQDGQGALEQALSGRPDIIVTEILDEILHVDLTDEELDQLRPYEK